MNNIQQKLLDDLQSLEYSLALYRKKCLPTGIDFQTFLLAYICMCTYIKTQIDTQKSRVLFFHLFIEEKLYLFVHCICYYFFTE